MKKFASILMCLVLALSLVYPAAAKVGTYKGDGYTYFGGLKNGKPSGLGVEKYKSGALSLGVFDPKHGYKYGYAVTVDLKSTYFYYHLSAGFQANSFDMRMLDKFDYEDAGGHRVCYTLSNERGREELALGTKKYSSGTVYYGEMRSGTPAGYGLYADKEGNYWGGLIVDGQLNGWGVSLKADGTGHMGTYADNKLDGFAYAFDKNGDAFLCLYESGELKEQLNGNQPLTSDQTSQPPEVLASNLDTSGLIIASGTSDNSGRNKEKKTCSLCHGKGWIDCPHCDGVGYTWSTYHVNPDGTKTRTRLDCGSCIAGMKRCPRCFGSGKE